MRSCTVHLSSCRSAWRCSCICRGRSLQGSCCSFWCICRWRCFWIPCETCLVKIKRSLERINCQFELKLSIDTGWVKNPPRSSLRFNKLQWFRTRRTTKVTTKFTKLPIHEIKPLPTARKVALVWKQKHSQLNQIHGYQEQKSIFHLFVWNLSTNRVL